MVEQETVHSEREVISEQLAHQLASSAYRIAFPLAQRPSINLLLFSSRQSVTIFLRLTLIPGGAHHFHTRKRDE